ncbi:MAG: sn-glycerol-1-phosphate dehydrogenase [bacterium]
MKRDTIKEIIEGKYADPDGGAPLSVPTRSVVIAESLAGMEAEAVAALNLGNKYAVVSDENTYEALGSRIERALKSIGAVTSVMMLEKPHADIETVERLKATTAGCDALVAVGSGTINDLCKYTAALMDKEYVVFGTAPSMNGYTSVNASITVGGLKKTLPAIGAKGVFLDLKVLAAAPKRMILSGLGDSVCRPTAQTDWLLAHLLLGQPYREAPFTILAEFEDELFETSGALAAGDLEAMDRLARTLVLSGFGMTICAGSQPASQAEHLISHYIDMLGSPDWPESFHGEQIGVTALTVARLQERILAGGAPSVKPSAIREADLIERFGPEIGPPCWSEFSKKRLDSSGSDAMNEKLQKDWDGIKNRISKAALPSEAIEKALLRAGAFTAPEELGWPRDFYKKAVRHAREIRNRYTFLDLAGDAGMLEDID